jgi:hypothetical protein
MSLETVPANGRATGFLPALVVDAESAMPAAIRTLIHTPDLMGPSLPVAATSFRRRHPTPETALRLDRRLHHSG